MKINARTIRRNVKKYQWCTPAALCIFIGISALPFTLGFSNLPIYSSSYSSPKATGVASGSYRSPSFNGYASTNSQIKLRAIQDDADSEGSWSSGMLPQSNKKMGMQFSLGSFATTTIAALALFFSVDEASIAAYSNDVMQASGLPSTVVANAQDKKQMEMSPPPVTSTSTDRTLAIASDLNSLNSRMFGAYWCSHCYEQKQRLGREAMAQIPYIECAKDGINSQKALCDERDVPGYPTWEIGGKLYPGEMYLDELENIIKDVKTGQ